MKRLILIIVFLILISDFAICKEWNNEDIAHLIQSMSLIYIDVFECTKIGITKEGRKEDNPIAKFFTDRNMYNELFLGAITLNFLAYKIKITRQYYLIGLAIAEIWAISTWEKHDAKFLYFIKF